MDKLWYVTADGEPLGVMTMREALQWGFERGEATLFFEQLEINQQTEKRK